MNKVVFDTNVLISLFNQNSVYHSNALILVEKHLEDTILIPHLVVAEFLVREPDPNPCLQALRDISEHFLVVSKKEIITMNALPYNIRKKLKANDCLILAHCINNKAELCTFDEELKSAFRQVTSS